MPSEARNLFSRALTSISASARVFARLRTCHYAAQKDVTHLSRQLSGVSINSRVMPGVDPVHHAKQAQHRDAGGELQSADAFQFVQQSHTDAVVLALDG